MGFEVTLANSTQGDDECDDQFEEHQKYYQRLAFNTIWADPADNNQEAEMNRSMGRRSPDAVAPEKKYQKGFTKGHRGEDSVVYGFHAIEDFLKETGCQLIMRAHDATAGGVKICKHAKVITVFSTSKDHGVSSGAASCACVLVDRDSISVINRSPSYAEEYVMVD